MPARVLSLNREMENSSMKNRIGVMGVGFMGMPIAGNLHQDGFDLIATIFKLIDEKLNHFKDRSV